MTKPYYRFIGHEAEVFRHTHASRLPLMLKGPTGCGKSRFVEAMASELDRPLVTVACHDETSAVDLLGRYVMKGGETVWQDGPVTRAVRSGALLYLDEIAEAREDVVVVLHPLTDHRRQLFIDRHDEQLQASDDFMLIVSFNPGYQRGLKELKQSTRQRFVAMTFAYPSAAIEVEILQQETQVDRATAQALVGFATRVRRMEELGLSATASTRLLVDAARLIVSGLERRLACDVAVVQPLTDDPATSTALRELAALLL